MFIQIPFPPRAIPQSMADRIGAGSSLFGFTSNCGWNSASRNTGSYRYGEFTLLGRTVSGDL